jgi:hypothetical protein
LVLITIPNPMKKITIFLASSNELKAERKEFEIEIGRKNKMWEEKGITLHLVIWEDLSARMMPKGSQDKYNEYVRSADLFVLLAATKIGMYTAEEFDAAFGQFSKTNKPFIFTYFKIVAKDQIDSSLTEFQQKLSNLKHFYSHFPDSNDLWNQFNKELDRLEKDEFRQNNFQQGITVNNEGAIIKNQFNGGTFNNTVFN